MCLILFAFQSHSRYKLIFAANRDEFYHRPTAPARWWKEARFLLAGKDLEAGGTWMGITKNGKIAALTNYRGTEFHKENAPSRGALVSQYLLSNISSQEYLEELQAKSVEYNGFNLILGNMDKLCCYSNRQNKILQVPPGVHGLSNDSLDTPWPKVVKGKQILEQQVLNQPEISLESIFSFLADTEMAPDDQLPDTGVGIEYERVLSSIFIKSPQYGTRSSTVVLVDNDNHVTFAERGFVPPWEKKYQFKIHHSS
ncbi:MAG: NRDE family protein [Candidatus Aminicenantes bacterium]|nr:MAG: NRDE family protein [Candidatus Aminicenantes bacterium]